VLETVEQSAECERPLPGNLSRVRSIAMAACVMRLGTREQSRELLNGLTRIQGWGGTPPKLATDYILVGTVLYGQ